MLTTIAVEGYRSLRELVMPLGTLTVVTGANGSGKSSLYRLLRLLAATAQDGAIASIAAEGGLTSTLWAGPERLSSGMRTGNTAIQGTVRSHPVALKLGFAADDFGYALDLGLPAPGITAFGLDPEIKTESIWHGTTARPSTLLVERRGAIVRLREGREWITSGHRLEPWASILSEVADADAAPEVLALKRELGSWRFYDHLRTDADSPARHSVIGTRTPVLAADGRDVAAAIQTIRELEPHGAFDDVISEAFPGSTVEITVRSGLFQLEVRQSSMLRPLAASELSDGTLRYILLATALLSPRPARLLVLNEPETSLHPELLAPLARLIVTASTRSQVIVVSHSGLLVDALEAAGALRHTLAKTAGDTVIVGQGALDAPPWHWPKR